MPIAFSFALLDLTGSASALGLVLAVGFGSRIALMLVGGLVADRLPRKRVMIGADAARACTKAAVATLFLLGEAKIRELLVPFIL
jgi:MFS family permease